MFQFELPRSRRSSLPTEFSLSLTEQDILEDLSWPGLPPGRWSLERETEGTVPSVSSLPRAA